MNITIGDINILFMLQDLNISAEFFTLNFEFYITDLLINSNSINLENYPLSGYVYPDKRVIKILGWNKD